MTSSQPILVSFSKISPWKKKSEKEKEKENENEKENEQEKKKKKKREPSSKRRETIFGHPYKQAI